MLVADILKSNYKAQLKRKKIYLLGLVAILLFLIGCASNLNQKQRSVIDTQNQQQIRLNCEKLRADLPIDNPKEELTGSVELFNGEVHQIVRFGKIKKHNRYLVSDVPVPDIPKKSCSDIPFSQVKEIVFNPNPSSDNGFNGGSYLVKLKNNQSFKTRGNIPFSLDTTPPNVNYKSVTTLVGGLDESKGSWFWYIYINPITQKPTESAVRFLEEVKKLTIN